MICWCCSDVDLLPVAKVSFETCVSVADRGVRLVCTTGTGAELANCAYVWAGELRCCWHGWGDDWTVASLSTAGRAYDASVPVLDRAVLPLL